jgi:hypothetical protein
VQSSGQTVLLASGRGMCAGDKRCPDVVSVRERACKASPRMDGQCTVTVCVWSVRAAEHGAAQYWSSLEWRNLSIVVVQLECRLPTTVPTNRPPL